jgi:hypothetical protein
MSFGWSVGDIATAVSVVYNLIEALDTCNGAAADYRSAVTFLRDLKQTLELLKESTVWDPTYRHQIEERVVYIKGPLDKFLKEVVKFEPGLGEKVKAGRRRHVVCKLQWFIFVSKEVLALRKKSMYI